MAPVGPRLGWVVDPNGRRKIETSEIKTIATKDPRGCDGVSRVIRVVPPHLYKSVFTTVPVSPL
jgi:hypothetical protein